MPRRGQISKRAVLPDPLYNSELVTKLVNNIMYDGKKGVAQKIVYDAFAMIEAKSGENALDVFLAALENVMPVLEVKARRVGGSNYQVPMEVRAERRQTLGLRWITAYARARGEKTMAERLANEIMDAKSGMGGAFKKKEEGDSAVLRLYNTHTEAVDLTVMLADCYQKANLLTLGEELVSTLPLENGKLILTVPAKKILTIELVSRKETR